MALILRKGRLEGRKNKGGQKFLRKILLSLAKKNRGILKKRGR